MSIEGKLVITLHRGGGDGAKVDIQSTRPLHASGILEGKKTFEALSLLPRLFSICATAQAAAGARAMESALGMPSNSAIEAARDMLVLFETAREHVLRMALDWPKILNEPVKAVWAQPLTLITKQAEATLFEGGGFVLDPQLSASAPVQSLIGTLRNILEKEVFAAPVETWLDDGTIKAWDTWVAERQTPAARLVALVRRSGWSRAGDVTPDFLPVLDDKTLSERLMNDDYIARPDWQGRVFETTSLARRQSHPLIVALSAEKGWGMEIRLAAKLVELASLTGQLTALAAQREGAVETAPSEEGIGQADAARGRLVHRVRVENDTVVSYRILAPTEWNFHPRGVVAKGLAALPERDERDLRAQAALLIETIDPCVGYELTVH